MRVGSGLNLTLTAAALWVAAALAFAPPRCQAEPLRVLSAGACGRFVAAMAAEYGKQGGPPVSVEQDTVGRLVQRINQAERFDVALLTPAALERVAPAFTAGHPVVLARIGIGVAVRENTPRPDIRSVEAFKRSLRLARSIAYVDPAAGGSSGIYLSLLMERLGIADSIRTKVVLVPGGSVAQRIATGEAEIGLQMISELVGVKGVALVGPLPARIQNYTVYAGVTGASAPDPGAAHAFLDFLSSPRAAAALKAAGMERPAAR
jgi:molybdate transport system substrate-binding protein